MPLHFVHPELSMSLRSRPIRNERLRAPTGAHDRVDTDHRVRQRRDALCEPTGIRLNVKVFERLFRNGQGQRRRRGRYRTVSLPEEQCLCPADASRGRVEPVGKHAQAETLQRRRQQDLYAESETCSYEASEGPYQGRRDSHSSSRLLSPTWMRSTRLSRRAAPGSCSMFD